MTERKKVNLDSHTEKTDLTRERAVREVAAEKGGSMAVSEGILLCLVAWCSLSCVKQSDLLCFDPFDQRSVLSCNNMKAVERTRIV